MRSIRLYIINFFLITLLASFGFPNQKIDQKKTYKPNVIFILVDDMGYSDLACYGSEINTPNLDNLANNGIRFTQMHNTSKCFPSRSCLLIGVYAQQNGMSVHPGSFININQFIR